MGFIAPSPAPFDLAEWRTRSHLERIRPLTLDWVENGFGTPSAIYLLYLVKIAVYGAGGLALIGATTKGLGPLGDLSTWWTQPLVFQKAVVWTLLWEVLGLGCGSMPLTFRFLPPVGGFLYWLRPGTMRLAPWPAKVPFTRGTTRTPADVLLYALLLAGCGWLLALQEPSRTRWLALLVPLALIGLRDKAIFLAARPEIYATMSLVFLFPLTSFVFGLKLVMLAMWWGAASSKLNQHFPFVVTVMISNSPLQRVKALKRAMYVDYPRDIRPSWLAGATAHGGTVVELAVPLVLILSRGGALTTVAVTVMVLFHVHITSTFPLGVPLEWNLFVIFATLFLFGHYASVGASGVSPLLVLVLALLLVGAPVLGNLRPDLMSFLPSMRYYAGNWATSQWAFAPGAEDKLNQHLVSPMKTQLVQLTKLYDAPTAELLLYKGLAFRTLHSHGRALLGLLPRACIRTGSQGSHDLDTRSVRDGELVAGMALGWNFGEGHLHGLQLLAAIQERCRFEPGELRVVMLESQPFWRPQQRYTIADAADGVLEEGLVQVADMTSRQPWLDDAPFPVTVLRSTAAA